MPVLMIGFSIQLLLSVGFVWVVVLQVVDYDSVPGMFRSVLHGVFWPDHWISSRSDSYIEPFQLFRVESIICTDMLNPLTMFATFGLSSPPLAVLIALVMMTRMTMWHWAVTRFVSTVSKAEDRSGRSDEVLAKLSKACIRIDALVIWSYLLLAGVSMMFIMFMVWDTTASVTWEGPLLASLVVVSSVLWLRYKSSRLDVHPNEEEELSTEGSIRTIELKSKPLVNPMIIQRCASDE